MNDIIARYTSLNEIAWVGRRMWRVSLRWFSSRGATVLVHAHSCTPGKSGSQPFSTPAVSLCLCRFSHARCHPPCTCFFLPFSTRFIYPSSFYSRIAGTRTRACTHAEFNPLCDDERTPLESFDIGDVGKYIEGRIYRIFFSTQSARCSGPDGEFLPRYERGVSRNYYRVEENFPGSKHRRVMKICPVDETREFRRGRGFGWLETKKGKGVSTRGIPVGIKTFNFHYNRDHRWVVEPFVQGLLPFSC